VVADALSRKGQNPVSRLHSMLTEVKSGLLVRIKAAQIEAMLSANDDNEGIGKKKRLRLMVNSRGFYTRYGRIWVPIVGGYRELTLEEAHRWRYTNHPGATKMYGDLKPLYWWPIMKLEVAFVQKCVTCSKVKGEHRKPYSELQQIEIPEWK